MNQQKRTEGCEQLYQLLSLVDKDVEKLYIQGDASIPIVKVSCGEINNDTQKVRVVSSSSNVNRSTSITVSPPKPFEWRVGKNNDKCLFLGVVAGKELVLCAKNSKE